MKKPKGQHVWTVKVGEKGQIVIPILVNFLVIFLVTILATPKPAARVVPSGLRFPRFKVDLRFALAV